MASFPFGRFINNRILRGRSDEARRVINTTSHLEDTAELDTDGPSPLSQTSSNNTSGTPTEQKGFDPFRALNLRVVELEDEVAGLKCLLIKELAQLGRRNREEVQAEETGNDVEMDEGNENGEEQAI